MCVSKMDAQDCEVVGMFPNDDNYRLLRNHVNLEMPLIYSFIKIK